VTLDWSGFRDLGTYPTKNSKKTRKINPISVYHATNNNKAFILTKALKSMSGEFASL